MRKHMTDDESEGEFCCPMAQIRAIPLEARIKYWQHRSNAKQRGIGWEFTLASWWQSWSDSGRWLERGMAPHLYAMGRRLDRGPYSPTNTYICTNSQNQKDVHRFAPGKPRIAKVRLAPQLIDVPADLARLAH